jgi:hypothetical protein
MSFTWQNSDNNNDADADGDDDDSDDNNGNLKKLQTFSRCGQAGL